MEKLVISNTSRQLIFEDIKDQDLVSLALSIPCVTFSIRISDIKDRKLIRQSSLGIGLTKDYALKIIEWLQKLYND